MAVDGMKAAGRFDGMEQKHPEQRITTTKISSEPLGELLSVYEALRSGDEAQLTRLWQKTQSAEDFSELIRVAVAHDSYPAHLSQVCNLDTVESAAVSEIMGLTDVSDVWGVGPRLTQQLREAGVATALDLRRLDPAMVRNRWSVVLERTVLELNGVQCLNVEDVPSARKEIACTRSFASPVRSLQILEDAVGDFVQRAAVKLRKQGSVAGQVLVFLRTSPFRSGPRHTPHAAMQTLEATNDSRVLTGLALMGLRMIHRVGYDYMKAGVVLQDLGSESLRQTAFDFDLQDRGSEVMGVVDALNQRYGRGTIGLGGSMVDRRPVLEDWRPRQNLLTPCYTTRWSDIPVARA